MASAKAAAKASKSKSKPEPIRIAMQAKALGEVLAPLALVVKSKGLIPGLECARFAVEDFNLTITATNLDLYIERTVEAEEVKGRGEFLIPLRKLLDFVRQLDSEVIIEATPKKTEVRAGNARLSWLTPAVEFSEMPEPPAKMIQLEGPSIARAFAVATPIAVAREGRYVFDCVSLTIDGNQIQMASTDGHRLTHIEFEHPLLEKEKGNWLIPKKAAAAIQALFELNEHVLIGSTANHLLAETQNCRIVTRLLTGNFPAIAPMIEASQAGASIATIDAGIFGRALERVRVMAEGKDAQSVRLKFTKNKITLEIDRRDDQVGIATDFILAQYEGDPFEVALNARYLADALTIGDQIQIYYAGLGKPVQLRNELGGKTCHVIAPIHPNFISNQPEREEDKED